MLTSHMCWMAAIYVNIISLCMLALLLAYTFIPIYYVLLMNGATHGIDVVCANAILNENNNHVHKNKNEQMFSQR